MFKEVNQPLAEAASEDDEIHVVIYKTPEGDFTTWWRIGISVFEIKDGHLDALRELVDGAIDYIEEEKNVSVQ